MELLPKWSNVNLLTLLALLPLAELQLLYHHQNTHPRQLYYEAPPRLRRLEYAAPSAAYVGGYSVAPPALHYQQQIPNFQLINYRPNYQPLALEYQQQQPPIPAPAPPLPAIYPQPSVQYQQRAIAPHAELAKYRYEGNYIPVQRVPILAQQPQQAQIQPQPQPHPHPQPQRRVEEHLYNVPPALFTSDVLHVVPSRTTPITMERPRRYAGAAQEKDQDAQTAETKTKETKYYHDIFMRFNGPTSRSHGHVLNHPKAQERRFETQRGTNRYKGEVIWTDRQGSHGEHRWDLAQGKL